MTQWAVHNLATKAIRIDENRCYKITDNSPLYRPEPMAKDDGLAIFDTLEGAEEWRLGHER